MTGCNFPVKLAIFSLASLHNNYVSSKKTFTMPSDLSRYR